MKKSICFILIISILICVIPLNTFAATDNKLIKEILGNSSWSGEDYSDEFEIKNKSDISFLFKSKSKFDIYLYSIDEYSDTEEIAYIPDVKSLTKKMILSKGKYEIKLYLIDAEKIGEPNDFSLIIYDTTLYSTNIKFNESKKICRAGSKFTLKPVCYPINSTPKKISYSSSNSKIATVNQSGTVIAKGYGKSVITAALDNGTKAIYTVVVNTKNIIKNIIFNYSSLDYSYFPYEHYYNNYFKLDKTQTIKFTYSSEIVSNIKISSDEHVVFSKDNVKSFTKTITLKKGDYSIEFSAPVLRDNSYVLDKTFYCNLLIQDITVNSTVIKINSNKKICSVGSKFDIKLTYSPKGSIPKSTTFSSSNKKVATVDKNGKVTAKGLGKCTITAKLDNGKKATLTVIVNNKTLYVFKGKSRNAPLINGKTKSKWKSSKKSIAKVNAQKFYGVKSGNIKFTTKVSGINYSCNFYVVDYNSMKKKLINTLKSELNDPRSLVIYKIVKDYDSKGYPFIVCDYGAKNYFGGMSRGYCEVTAQYNFKNKKIFYKYTDID